MNDTLEFVKKITTDDILNNLHRRKEMILLSISPDFSYSREHGGLVGIYDEKTQSILDDINHQIEQRQFKIERMQFAQKIN